MAKQKGTTSKSSNTLQVDAAAGADCSALLAQTVLRPSVQAAATLQKFKVTGGDIEIGALMRELQGQVKLASSGNLDRAEAMLVTQAHTLDAIFNNLARRASGCDYLSQFETYFRLGLKAQSQCRATLETLAAIKNPPPVTFVRQANVAHGPQQINNGPQPSGGEASRARESENLPNKLLEQQRNDWLDNRATQATVGADSTLEAMGEVHGAADAGR